MMVGPRWILFLTFFTFSETVVSYNIYVSQVTRTETLVVSSESLDGENINLSSLITTLPNTTKSILNDGKIFSNIKDESEISKAETNTENNLIDSAHNVSNILKNKNDQLNSSKSQNGNSNSSIQPVQVKNIDIIPIKLKNITPQSSTEPQHPVSNISSTQKPERPAKPAGASSSNPNMTLVDRSAFVGDLCATGFVKVNGKCVEQM